MSLQTVRFRTGQDNAAQVRPTLDEVFAALRAAPRSLSYTAFENMSEPEYILMIELPEAGQLRDSIARWAGGPIPPQPFTVVGSYAS